MSVPKIGFSAYLKIINSNPRPQRTIVRQRCRPSSGGYDFHKSFRYRVQQVSFEGLSLAAALTSTQQISREPERNSARRALEQFFEWKDGHPGAMLSSPPVTFVSPAGLFKVEFIPDFCLEIGGRMTAVHLWNTQHDLSGHLVRAALSSVAARHPMESRPDDFAVLSLRDRMLYRWSEADRETRALGERLLELLDVQFTAARTELGIPASPELGEPRTGA
ncbi:hypothetical protein [Sinorhizobium fredii]|uniref:Uncharacterized protein n=2 Tax=Sinorhizobium TaxID=28105 RepID=A0A2L0H6V7_RHIFR|nr:hypothetical protein [Sinorhizobium fredii]AUX76489.1 hypothetical protein NXT3_CH01922 [Sinorhizobium fredii]RVQ53567.1 hypothetical protein CN245_22195 [Sinorhizobium meliloti]